MKKWILLILTVAQALLLNAGELNLDEAARIVIQANGRKKPLDTFASESLQTISGRRTFKDSATGRRLNAMDALLSMWLGTRDWNSVPVVLVSDARLRNALGLAPGERLYAFGTLLENRMLREFNSQIQSKRSRGEELTSLDREAEMVLGRMQTLNSIARGESLAIVPNREGAKSSWFNPAAVKGAYGEQAAADLAAALKRVSTAYAARDEAALAAGARELRAFLTALAPAHYPALSAINREIHYNRAHPFRWAWVLYVAAFFVLLAPKARRAGLGIFAGGLALQVYGFVLRCLIAGHAPVTNMYESVVWVSLGVAGFALVFDWIHRSRVYSLTAAPLAVLGLIIADLLPSVLNPNIGPLPPVLRDNFWLVTHVLTITLGYAAFALAMGLGHVILAFYLFKPRSMGEKSLYHHLLYRVLQIGVFLLAAGTILGGVWANYSWGRFWGWDPKETWALIALLFYIFAIHGRMAGWWGQFGLSVAAALCFNGVLMAWYGVNFVLGKGLHSYGFGGGGLQWIGSIAGLDLAFVGWCIWAHSRRTRLAPRPSGGAPSASRAEARDSVSTFGPSKESLG